MTPYCVRIKMPEHIAWMGMRARCLNSLHPQYRNYGGRGIKVSPVWMTDFYKFYADIGPKPTPKHSLDRIDNNRGYEPGNVRWATIAQQQSNRRPPCQGPYPRIHSKYRGVTRRRSSHWVARFSRTHIGVFKDEVDAATAYNFVAFEKLGDNATYNMPEMEARRPVQKKGRHDQPGRRVAQVQEQA